MPIQITDPRTLPPNFYFISKDGTFDFVSYLIKLRTQAEWNHSMLMRKPGFVVSQGMQLVEQPIDLYMKNGTRLDFFTLTNPIAQVLVAMNAYVDKRLAGNWLSKSYDILGIFGQLIGVPAIHTPGLDYCSEFTLSVLKSGTPFMSTPDSTIIMGQSVESQPQQLEYLYLNNPSIFTHYGTYESDNGVIVP
jgi:hypothetical protein